MLVNRGQRQINVISETQVGREVSVNNDQDIYEL